MLSQFLEMILNQPNETEQIKCAQTLGSLQGLYHGALSIPLESKEVMLKHLQTNVSSPTNKVLEIFVDSHHSAQVAFSLTTFEDYNKEAYRSGFEDGTFAAQQEGKRPSLYKELIQLCGDLANSYQQKHKDASYTESFLYVYFFEWAFNEKRTELLNTAIKLGQINGKEFALKSDEIPTNQELKEFYKQNHQNAIDDECAYYADYFESTYKEKRTQLIKKAKEAGILDAKLAVANLYKFPMKITLMHSYLCATVEEFSAYSESFKLNYDVAGFLDGIKAFITGAKEPSINELRAQYKQYYSTPTSQGSDAYVFWFLDIYYKAMSAKNQAYLDCSNRIHNIELEFDELKKQYEEKKPTASELELTIYASFYMAYFANNKSSDLDDNKYDTLERIKIYIGTILSNDENQNLTDGQFYSLVDIPKEIQQVDFPLMFDIQSGEQDVQQKFDLQELDFSPQMNLFSPKEEKGALLKRKRENALSNEPEGKKTEPKNTSSQYEEKTYFFSSSLLKNDTSLEDPSQKDEPQNGI